MNSQALATFISCAAMSLPISVSAHDAAPVDSKNVAAASSLDPGELLVPTPPLMSNQPKGVVAVMVQMTHGEWTRQVTYRDNGEGVWYISSNVLSKKVP